MLPKHRFVRQGLKHGTGCTQIAIASLLAIPLKEVCDFIPIRKTGTSVIAFLPLLEKHGYRFRMCPILASVRFSGRKDRHCVLIDELDMVYDGHLNKPMPIVEYLKNPTGSGRRRYIESINVLDTKRTKKDLDAIQRIFEKNYRTVRKTMKQQDTAKGKK